MEYALLEALIRACVHGGALALVVWLLTRTARRTPLSLRRWAWWLVCAKALLAFLGWGWIDLPLLPAHSDETPIPTQSVPLQPSVAPMDAPREANPATTAASLPALGASPVPSYASAVLAWLWGSIVAVLLVGLGRRWLQTERLWRAAEPMQNDAQRAELHRLCVQMELSFVPKVRLSDSDHPPMALAGNRILIPRRLWAQLSDAERRMVLAHELAHLQRGDVWWSLAPTLARTLFFFFPPISYAAHQWELGCEAASDVAALRIVGCTPYAYGTLLMRIAEQLRPAASPLGAGASSNFAYLRTRLQQLTPTRPSPAWTAALALIVLLALPWRITAQTDSPDRDALTRSLQALAYAEWGEAYEVGIQLASLPPEEGYALLTQHWSRLPVHARQQMLKVFYYTRPYPLRPRMHPKLLPVLELGARDRSPSVRHWAKTYAQELALRPFENDESLYAWMKQYRALPLPQVVRAHWEPFLRELPHLPEREREVRLTRLAESFAWLREPTVVLPLAKRYRLPALLTETLQAHRANVEKAELLQGMLECLFALSLSEGELRPALAPLLDPAQPCVVSVRAQAVSLLGSPRYAWAKPDLLNLARHALEQPVKPELWSALAEAFQRLEATEALPTLRAMHARADDPALRKVIEEAVAELEGM